MVEAVVIVSVRLAVVRWRYHGHLVPVAGVLGEEEFHFLRDYRWCHWHVRHRIDLSVPFEEEVLEHCEWAHVIDLSEPAEFI